MSIELGFLWLHDKQFTDWVVSAAWKGNSCPLTFPCGGGQAQAAAPSYTLLALHFLTAFPELGVRMEAGNIGPALKSPPSSCSAKPFQPSQFSAFICLRVVTIPNAQCFVIKWGNVCKMPSAFCRASSHSSCCFFLWLGAISSVGAVFASVTGQPFGGHWEDLEHAESAHCSKTQAGGSARKVSLLFQSSRSDFQSMRVCLSLWEHQETRMIFLAHLNRPGPSFFPSYRSSCGPDLAQLYQQRSLLSPPSPLWVYPTVYVCTISMSLWGPRLYSTSDALTYGMCSHRSPRAPNRGSNQSMPSITSTSRNPKAWKRGWEQAGLQVCRLYFQEIWWKGINHTTRAGVLVDTLAIYQQWDSQWESSVLSASV